MTDSELLENIIETKSADSFEAIVERYIGLVYAAALRQARDRTLAEDIAQAVFLVLWQRADRVGNRAALAGWLVNTTRLAALAAMRAERRLKKREADVATRQSGDTAVDVGGDGPDIAPLLDTAIEQLGEMDRTALSLRYLQEKSVEEVAEIMGITPAAASKRISRAILRLRTALTEQGCAIESAALPAALARQCMAAPAGLSSKAAAVVTTTGGSAALMIAQGVLMALQTKVISAAIVLVTLLILAAGMVWEGRLLFRGPGAASSASVDLAGEGGGAAPVIAGPPIKVGVILSYRTGVEVGWTGSPYGFGVQMGVLNELRDPKIQIIPIVEPGSATKAPMPGQLRRYFPSATPIDGGNAAELEKLDVIVASATWRTTDSVVDAVHEAVSNGVGLLNGAGMGVEGPEYAPDHPAVAELAGLIQGQYGWNSSVVACKVLQTDPLLGTLAKGAIVHMAPNGAYGILPKYAKPLIGLTKPDQAWGAGNNLSNNPAYVFYLLYESSLGRGRIVGVQFAPYMAMPTELQRATGNRFYIRCVEWLAGRPVQ